MAEVQLNVETREGIGTQASRKIRAEKKIPGIYYIHGSKNIPVIIDRTELHSIWGSASGLLDIIFDGKTHRKAVIRDIQFDPIKGTPTHIDLLGIKMTEKLKTTVQIQLLGTPEGVKTHGGILQQIQREIEIECLPSDIPASIDIDISELNIGDNIHVSDLKVEKAVILTDEETVVATVSAPRVVEETTAELEGEEGQESAEPEVLSQKAEDEE